MIVIKRNCEEEEFDKSRIEKAILKAMESPSGVYKPKIAEDISNELEEKYLKEGLDEISIYDIETDVYDALIRKKQKLTAKAYEGYRSIREWQRENQSYIDAEMMEMISGKSNYWNKENSNKKPERLNVRRDYMAGIASKDICRKYIYTPDQMNAHDEGIIQINDLDYRGMTGITNCCLINLEDMLQNGTVINGVKIDKPHRILTATTIATQCITAVASSQYGGCSISLTHLAPFVRDSENRIRNKYNKFWIFRKLFKKLREKLVALDLKKEVEDAVQTFNYQVNSMSTSNGQAPFITVFMYLGETEEYKKELAMLIEEFLHQRIKGIKNEVGVYVTQAFPKLLYVTEEDNIHEDSPYWYLTELAAKSTALRMNPDYVSEKIMKELKEGNCFPQMGCLAGQEHLYVKVNNEILDLTIEDFFNMCKNDEKIKGRPTQVYFNKEKNDEGIRIVNKHGNITAERLPGVYAITYEPLDLTYIGSSSDIHRRFAEHRNNIAKHGCLDGGVNYNDNSLDNYKFEVLKYTDDYEEEEKRYIETIPNVNFRGITNRYYKLSASKKDIFERPSLKVIQEPQEIINLEDKDIKVLDFNNKWTKVRHVFKNSKASSPLCMHIYYDEDGKEFTINATEDHPFFVGNGFKRADELKIGDCLYRADNKPLPITKITWYVDKIETFDIGTETGTFVGSDILMHNCRSCLSPWKDKNGNYKFYGRFNVGVVTLNLVDVALSSEGNVDTFWELLDKRLQLVHDTQMTYFENFLLGTSSDVAPILYQDGAFARLEKHQPIDVLLYGGYATISCGYAGLYECVKYMTGQSHSYGEGFDFGYAIMKRMYEACEKWKKEDNLGWGVYGTPIESATYRFAKCLKNRFGVIEGITDKDYITNSYHVNVKEVIDPFEKLAIESKYQALSSGGAVSYIEACDLTNNIDAVLNVIKYMYDNIMYAEINTKSDFCQVCGYNGEIKIIDEGGELIWECPNCKNRDQSKMNVARRTCGYIGTAFWNEGRTQEINERYVHIDNHEV